MNINIDLDVINIYKKYMLLDSLDNINMINQVPLSRKLNNMEDIKTKEKQNIIELLDIKENIDRFAYENDINEYYKKIENYCSPKNTLFKIYIKDKAPVPGVASPVAATPAVAAPAAAPAVAAPAAAPAVAAPAVATPVAAASKPWGKSGDANQDIGPAAVEAKSSTNKTNVGNFTIEDYIPNDRKMNDATYNYIPVATPGEVAAANPMGQDPAQRAQATAPAEVAAANPMGQDPAQRVQTTAPAEVAAEPARTTVSASETLSKVTLEAVNPVVVDALKKITTSSAPEAAALASNNSAEIMTKALSLFTNKCDEMIGKLEVANDIAAKILRQGY